MIQVIHQILPLIATVYIKNVSVCNTAGHFRLRGITWICFEYLAITAGWVFAVFRKRIVVDKGSESYIQKAFNFSA